MPQEIDPNADAGKTAAQLWAEEDAVDAGQPQGTTLADRLANPSADDEPAPASGPGAASQQVEDRFTDEPAEDEPAEDVPSPEPGLAPEPEPVNPAQQLATAAADEQESIENLRRALAEKDRMLEERAKAQRAADNKAGNALQRAQELEQALQEAKAAVHSTANPAGAQLAAGGGQPSPEQTAAAMQTPEAWAVYKADFPDWAKAMEAMVDARLADVKGQQPTGQAIDVPALKAELRNEMQQEHQAQLAQQQEAQTQAARQAEIAKLDEAHPSWRDLRNTPHYITWLERQAPEIKTLAGSSRGEDAITVISRFKKDLGVLDLTSSELNQQRETRKQRGAIPPNTIQNPKQLGGISEDEMTADQYWKWLDQKEKNRHQAA